MNFPILNHLRLALLPLRWGQLLLRWGQHPLSWGQHLLSWGLDQWTEEEEVGEEVGPRQLDRRGPVHLHLGG